MKKIRVAFIGMDHVHVHTLAYDFSRYPDRIEIVGIADYPKHQPDKLEYKKAHNFPKNDLKIWEDYKELLRQDIDVAVITTSVKDHTDCAVEVLGMNIHTLLEKPMAMNMQDAKRIYKAYKESSAELIVNWPIAWFPAYRKAKEFADSGIIGDILRVQYRTTQTRGPYNLNDHTEEELKDMWWYQSEKGGGSLCDYAGYGCTLTTWITGKVAKGVMGIKKNFMQKFCDAEDYSAFLIDFGDSVGFLEGSWSTGHHGDLATGPIVYGTKGIVVADRYDKVVRVYLDKRLYPDATSPHIEHEVSWIEDNIALNVADFIQHKTPLFDMVTADFNMKSMVALDAGARSCESGMMEKGEEI